MMELHRQYIVDENNCKIAVQMDIETFEKIEEVLENYGLYHLMLEDQDEELLDLEAAQIYYRSLGTPSVMHRKEIYQYFP